MKLRRVSSVLFCAFLTQGFVYSGSAHADASSSGKHSKFTQPISSKESCGGTGDHNYKMCFTINNTTPVSINLSHTEDSCSDNSWKNFDNVTIRPGSSYRAWLAVNPGDGCSVLTDKGMVGFDIRVPGSGANTWKAFGHAKFRFWGDDYYDIGYWQLDGQSVYACQQSSTAAATLVCSRGIVKKSKQ